jgi:hypothetical protein
LVEALRYKPKVAGSIPDGIILKNPSGRTMALHRSQALTKLFSLF